MSQVNPALFGTMSLKTELEAGQGANSAGEGAQYLSRVLKKPALEKPAEIWRTYLRRYDSQPRPFPVEMTRRSYGGKKMKNNTEASWELPSS